MYYANLESSSFQICLIAELVEGWDRFTWPPIMVLWSHMLHRGRCLSLSLLKRTMIDARRWQGHLLWHSSGKDFGLPAISTSRITRTSHVSNSTIRREFRAGNSGTHNEDTCDAAHTTQSAKGLVERDSFGNLPDLSESWRSARAKPEPAYLFWNWCGGESGGLLVNTTFESTLLLMR